MRPFLPLLLLALSIPGYADEGLYMTSSSGSGSGTVTVNPQTGATYTTVASDAIVTNTGNAGSLAITLLDDPTAGVQTEVCVTAAQTITISPNTGESMYFNGSTASSISSANVGSCARFTAVTGGSGAIWVVDFYSGPLS